ncbi:MAG: TlpA family protein disulfide reductase [Nonlabens sp.]|nr:TlpA family protein disulfide reductase [Nonlabens sp.]
MKKSLFIAFIILVTACKPKDSEQSRTILEADLTDNKVLHLTTATDSYTTLDDLITSNKGKVIYVDVWASWCGPCKQMMPASAALKERYKDKDVVFIYVSIDTNIDAWKQSAMSFNLPNEESFLARNYPKASFFQNNNVSNIPRYFLYDKTGRMIDDNAMRPAEQDLANTIDALLSL